MVCRAFWHCECQSLQRLSRVPKGFIAKRQHSVPSEKAQRAVAK